MIETEAAPSDRHSNLPPYVPFRTFTTFLEGLKVGMPSHIDRSVLGSMSGGMQSWLLASLRAMDLIDAHGIPSQALRALATAEGPSRKQALAALFESTYGFLAQAGIELATTTPSKLQSAFVDLGAKGETVEKCIAFLKALAKESGIELSPYLTKRSAARSRPTMRTRNRNVGEPEGEAEHNHDADTAELAAMKTVELPNAGGSLTLSGTFNLFSLVGTERDLVFAIIDKMNEYEKALEKTDE